MGIKVKMIQDFQDHKRGTIVVFGEASGKKLIDKGIAKLFNESQKKKRRNK